MWTRASPWPRSRQTANMATISPERLAALKNYMRVDGDADDALIAELYSASIEYLTAAGVYRTADNSARYDLAVNSLTLYDYDHRNDTNAASAPMPQGARRLVNQLKGDATAQTAVVAMEAEPWPS